MSLTIRRIPAYQLTDHDGPLIIPTATSGAIRRGSERVMWVLAGSFDMALDGFVEWLSDNHLRIPERGGCPNAVKLFLQWQRRQRECGADCTEEAYYDGLRQRGADEAQFAAIGAAIDVYRHYLSDVRAG
jgi:hypothetical protein